MSRNQERITKQLQAISDGLLLDNHDKSKSTKDQMSKKDRKANEAITRDAIIDVAATVIACLLDIREELGRIADCLEEANK
jgi:hypothetical protein